MTLRLPLVLHEGFNYVDIRVPLQDSREGVPGEGTGILHQGDPGGGTGALILGTQEEGQEL